MSLLANKSRLLAITKDLSVQWEQTKETWRDMKCREFEDKYLKDLFASVDAAARVLDELDKVLGKIRSDCE